MRVVACDIVTRRRTWREVGLEVWLLQRFVPRLQTAKQRLLKSKVQNEEETTHETLHRLRCVAADLLRYADCGAGRAPDSHLLSVLACVHRPGEGHARLLAAVCYLWRMHSPVARECAFNVRRFPASAVATKSLAVESIGVPWRMPGRSDG